MIGVQRAVLGLLAAGFALLALLSLTQYPLAALALGLGLAAFACLSLWRPSAWLFWLPALWPLLNFSPWSGWWLLDESDLLLLALLAGGYLRWSIDLGWPERRAHWTGWRGAGGLGCLCLVLALALLIGVLRGLADAGLAWAVLAERPLSALELAQKIQQGLYAGYDSAWNTLRVAKSLGWALLLLPLLQHALALEGSAAKTQLARGMTAGLALLCLLVLWERQQFAGVFDFSQAYRTSAWFWEMHVGGGAIDAYLALAAPFALWAVWTAPNAWRWTAANLLLWLTVYVVLTTYSRGIYLALLLALVFMSVSAWRLKIVPAAGPIWQGRSLLSVWLALLLQSALVFGVGAFMSERLARSSADLLGRAAHWQAGVGLLQTPADWLLGLGLGRLPAHYSRRVPGGEFPGQASWGQDAQGRSYVLLSGPNSLDALARHFGLTQRVRLQPLADYRLRVLVQTDTAARLHVSLCRRHLLFNRHCQQQWLEIPAVAAGTAVWREAVFQHPILHADARAVVLTLAPTRAAQQFRLHAVQLLDPHARQLLHNSDFAAHLQHWQPAAQGHFLPWHMDNLYLELLIERGLFGVLAFALLLLWALRHLWQGLRSAQTPAWVLMAALMGLLALGMVISVMEIPRVALILFLLLWAAQYQKE